MDSALRRNGCDIDGTLLGAGCVIASHVGVKNAPLVGHSCTTSVPGWFYSSDLTLDNWGTSGCFLGNLFSGNIRLLLTIEDLCFHRQEVSLSRSLALFICR